MSNFGSFLEKTLVILPLNRIRTDLKKWKKDVNNYANTSQNFINKSVVAYNARWNLGATRHLELVPDHHPNCMTSNFWEVEKISRILSPTADRKCLFFFVKSIFKLNFQCEHI